MDLRFRMGEVLRVLAKRESVQVLYRGKPKAMLVPLAETHGAWRGRIREHEMFGMCKGDTQSVPTVMTALRGGRHRDL